MRTIYNSDIAAEQDAWQTWVDEQADWQEAMERRRADAERVEANVADEEAQAKRYNEWLMNAAFRDMNYLFVDLEEEN